MMQPIGHREMRGLLGWWEHGRTADHQQLDVAIQLARFDRMREFERRCHLALRWICRVLIELELRNRDCEYRRLSFINQALHQDLRWEEFFIENDSKFLIGWPIGCGTKAQLFVRIP